MIAGAYGTSDRLNPRYQERQSPVKNFDQTFPASIVVLTDLEATRLVELMGDIVGSEHPAQWRHVAKRIQTKVTNGRKLFMPR